MVVLQVIIGLLFCFILPGYLISWLFLKKLDFIDRIGVSVGLSLCVNILMSLILGFLGIFNAFFVYGVLIVIILILFFLLRKNLITYLKTDFSQLKDKKTLIIFLILVVLLIFNFILIYQVHSNYSGLIQNPHNDAQYYEVKDFRYDLPIHADEWAHLAKAVYFIENGKIEFVNPYLVGSPYFPNYEVGFNIFTSEFFLLMGLDPILNFKNLPAIFMIINSLLLFIFIRKATKNNYIGLLSVLFFGSLKSNINLMGNWFFVPMGMSLFLMFLFFYLLLNYFENKEKSYLIFTIITYFITLTVYPLTSIFITLVFAFFLFVKFYRKKLSWIVALGAIILTFFSLKFFDLYFLRFDEWTKTSVGYITYNIFSLYGYLFFLLALIGTVLVFLKKRNKILLAAFIPLFFIIIDRLIGLTYFIPYTRAVYYLLLFLVPLSAIGLCYLLEQLLRLVRIKSVGIILVIILLFVVFIYGLKNYYNINEQKNVASVESKNLVLLYLLENQDYEAIRFIEHSYEGGNLVFTDPWMAVGVYPISKKHIKGIIESNLGGWQYDLESGSWKRDDPLIYFKFLEADCKNKYSLVKNADLVLSRIPIDCPEFREVYNKGNYIYEVIS